MPFYSFSVQFIWMRRVKRNNALLLCTISILGDKGTEDIVPRQTMRVQYI